MHTDPVVSEIRMIREQLAAQFNYDVAAIGRDARERDALGDRLVVRREPRPPSPPMRLPAKTAYSVPATTPRCLSVLDPTNMNVVDEP